MPQESDTLNLNYKLAQKGCTGIHAYLIIALTLSVRANFASAKFDWTDRAFKILYSLITDLDGEFTM